MESEAYWSIVSATVALIVREVLAFILKWNKAKRQIDRETEVDAVGAAVANRDELITRLNRRIGSLENRLEGVRTDYEEKLDLLRDEHTDCIREQALLRGQLGELHKAFERHQEANKAHVDLLRQELDRFLADGKHQDRRITDLEGK